ncbi:pentapeptide repeat-containing protein [Gammaproteobacteria bacterium]|nr:pentapeptide repeat-containing protein [Gammaproteobacteria bacterium]
MKFLSIYFCLFMFLASSQSVVAYLDDDLQRLLKTKSCPGCNLSQADLVGLNLRGANLRGANLRGADLRGANLREAQLDRANIDESDLFGADLSYSNLAEVSLSRAFLRGANLSGVDLTGVDLSGMDLTGTNLSKTILVDAELSVANLSEADLSGAILVGSNFSGAKLNKTDLSWAYLYNAKLIRTDLSDANLIGARFGETDLTDAVLTGAHLSVDSSQGPQSDTTELGVVVKGGENYPEITSFDFRGNVVHMTSKAGKLYRLTNGGTPQYENYVRNYPDLLAAYKKTGGANPIEDWGKWHWDNHGQFSESRTLPVASIELDFNDVLNFQSDQEVGLLSVVSNENSLYLSYTIQEDDSRYGNFLVIDEFTHQLIYTRTIAKIRTGSTSHVAGTLVFDSFGKLYVSVGEGGIDDNSPQNLDSLLGKVLRIDVSQRDPKPEIVAYGLRNPWKISIDSKNRMFIGDCGEATIESIYLLDDLYPTAPYNLGWPVFEGTKRKTDDLLRFENTLAPIYEYRHHNGVGVCVIGGFFLDDLGVYIFGDYLGRLRLLKEIENGSWHEIYIQETRGVLSLGYDAETNLVYMSSWKEIHQLEISNEQINSPPRLIYCRTIMPDKMVRNSGC